MVCPYCKNDEYDRDYIDADAYAVGKPHYGWVSVYHRVQCLNPECGRIYFEEWLAKETGNIESVLTEEELRNALEEA